MIDSLSSGERTGKSLNACMCKRCSVATCGSWDFLSGGATHLGNWQFEEEQDWKAWPKWVIAP